ncbi:YggT family protein [Streptococcus sp. SK140]|uniref:YggT family protein n=1 Tax=Streptococcus sp. SK140 TaxID=1095726 RepID=UPI00025B192B|nr:YggT family protein [Streptococcus sp. SK140]EIF36739.1 YGGT family protein [Streptococcus sp. SK140]
MIFLIRFIQNAATIYSWILVAFALLSWFPNAYDTALGRLLTSLVKPILQPLRRLPLSIGGIDFSVWVAVILVHLVGNYLIRFLLILA